MRRKSDQKSLAKNIPEIKISSNDKKMPSRENTLNKLESIFPQLNIRTVRFIYDEVSNLFGNNPESEHVIFSSCIERLLELPDDFIPPLMPEDLNNRLTNHETVATLINHDEVIRDNNSGYSNKNYNNNDNIDTYGIAETDNHDNKKPTVALRDYGSDSSLDSSVGSNESSLNELSFHDYRSKEMPKYRGDTGSSSSNSSSDTDYFPASFDDDVMLLEALSTPQEGVRLNVYDKDDVVILSANKNDETAVNRPTDAAIIKSTTTNPPGENERKRKSDNFPGLNNSAKKIKAASATTQTRVTTASCGKSTSTITSPLSAINTLSSAIGTSSSTITTPLGTIASHSGEVPPQSIASNSIKLTTSSHGTFREDMDYSHLIKGMVDFEKHARMKIKAVIEDVTEVHLNIMLRNIEPGTTMDDTVSRIITSLLDNKDYPKEPKIKRTIIATSSTTSSLNSYKLQAIEELQRKFPKVSTKVFRAVFAKEKYNFTGAYKKIKDIVTKINNGEAKVEDTLIGSFLKGRRNVTSLKPRETILQKELNNIREEEKKSFEDEDHKTAMAINTIQYEQDGQLIECGCCYIESSFDTMVQCYEGHLFCSECLRDYSKEATFGSGRTHLQCMTDGCEASFPLSQLQKALPENILSKFLEREQDESLKLANLENLFRCPHCEFGAVVGKNDKVFSCQNPSCMKETCMHCKEAWDDEHFGVPCKEMEKKDVTNLRTTYEEKMTQAKVRTCWQCGTIFLKSSGCNKMTCRCGAKMCYICRKSKIDYGHFCQHPRDPGQTCAKCNSCSLWTDPEEDDNRAVAEIQKEAELERKKLAGEQSVEENHSHIGPTIDVAILKAQNRQQQQHQQQHQQANIQQYQQFLDNQQIHNNQHRQHFAGGRVGAGGRGGGGRNRGRNRGNRDDWVDLVLNMQGE